MRAQARDGDTSTFRIRRSILTTNGIGSEVDQNVVQLLKELDDLLGKPVFGRSLSPAKAAKAGKAAAAKAGKAAATAPSAGSGTTAAGATGPVSPGAATGASAPATGAAAAAPGAAAAGPAATASSPAETEIRNFLDLVLSPKHAPKRDTDATHWDDDSLADSLTRAPAGKGYSLSDYIDKTPQLARLKYYVAGEIKDNWGTTPFNSRVVLEDHPNIQDYLIAYAYYKLSISEEDALRHVIINNRAGTRVFADYAAVSAARYLIEEEQLKVGNYNDNGGKFTKQLIASGLPLSSVSFEKSLREEIREFIFDRDEEKIITDSNTFKMLPTELQSNLLPKLIAYLQQSPLRPQIAAKIIDIDDYLPTIIVQLLKQKTVATFGTATSVPDQSHHVQFFDDARDPAVEVNKEAVLFASQLYHGMVLGDELDVFGAVHYLAHRRMNVFGGMRIKDRTLRDDLHRYVFDNRYLDLGDRRQNPQPTPIERFRTRPAERHMFHRQVFDDGMAEMPEDMLVNRDFKRLWKVLMLESARYLDRAQASLNPENYVSRQNVMQAVEDLQYNLSTHCTGMATVISPAIDAELNFILERILKHEEVLLQVVPEGGNWKRAVDKLNQERRRAAGPAITLYNKALLGKDIIERIANYVASEFERNSAFSDFIGKVDAFITTQSILQRSAKLMLEDYGQEEEEEAEPDETEMPHLLPPEQTKPANGSAASADEWDF